MFRLMLGMIPFLLSAAFSGTSDANDDESDSTDHATGKSGGSDDRTFSQADIDRIFNDRLARERRKLADEVRADLRKQWDDEQHRKQQEEQQEFKPLYEKALEDKTAAERKADEVAAQYRTRLAKVQIEKAAENTRLAAPTVAYKLIDFDQVQYTEDGDPTNIPALVKKLAEDYPDLVKPEDTKRNGIEDTPKANGQDMTKDDIKNKYLQQAGVQT